MKKYRVNSIIELKWKIGKNNIKKKGKEKKRKNELQVGAITPTTSTIKTLHTRTTYSHVI